MGAGLLHRGRPTERSTAGTVWRVNGRRLRAPGRVASIGLLGAIILALSGCSEEYDVAVGLSDGDVVVVVPSCFDEVSVIELATREIQNNRVEYSTVWRLEALTPDEQIDTVTAGRDVAGFTTAHHLIEMPESELVVFVDSVEPGPSASAVFRLSELRDDQLLFDGQYGTKEDFERSQPCGEPFSVVRSIVVPLLLIVVLPLFGIIFLISYMVERLQQRREAARRH